MRLGVLNLFTVFILGYFFVLLYVDLMQFRKKQDISPKPSANNGL